MKSSSYPKIGIRPTIDGRLGGVRESLEERTMQQAQAVAALIAAELRYPDGTPVECVIADTCIGGVKEAADCADKFKTANVGVSLTVTPCWCYGSETMDMDPHLPKAVWGFNGTERPGAVYLAAVLAGHTQKGLPAFGIYGKDVQSATDTEIPADVRGKLLSFVQCGLAVALMRGKSYLSMGGTSMGIAGSVVDPALWEKWFGMRVEAIDLTEFVGRMMKGQYDQAEYEKALAWVKTNCPEGKDYNSPATTRSREQIDKEWEDSVKMALIARDLMIGNPVLAEMGLGEQAHGHNAIAAGFQGQRQWTDHFPNGDFLEAILNSSFDWNGKRAPYIVATENDALNGAGMLFGHLLTNTAQIFADLRTYWSLDAIETASGKKFSHPLVGDGILHLINSGPAALDGTGEQETERQTDDETLLGNHRRRGGKMPQGHHLAPVHHRILPRRRTQHPLPHPGRHAGHDDPPQPRRRHRSRAASGGRLHRGPAGRRARRARPTHQPDLADHLVRPGPNRQGRVHQRLRSHEPLGSQPLRHDLRPRGPPLSNACLHAAHSGLHAQRRRGPRLPPERMDLLRHRRSRRRGLPRLRELRPALRQGLSR